MFASLKRQVFGPTFDPGRRPELTHRQTVARHTPSRRATSGIVISGGGAGDLLAEVVFILYNPSIRTNDSPQQPIAMYRIILRLSSRNPQDFVSRHLEKGVSLDETKSYPCSRCRKKTRFPWQISSDNLAEPLKRQP